MPLLSADAEAPERRVKDGAIVLSDGSTRRIIIKALYKRRVRMELWEIMDRTLRSLLVDRSCAWLAGWLAGWFVG